MDTYYLNFVNFGTGLPQYHVATRICPSLMHYVEYSVKNEAILTIITT